MIKISWDDGKNWIDCPNGVRVNIEGQVVDEEENPADLAYNFTHEGVIVDLWRITGNAEVDDLVNSTCGMYNDIVSGLEHYDDDEDDEQKGLFFVDLPILDNHGVCKNVHTAPTKEEAVRWIRNNLCHCDDKGNICLLTYLPNEDES
jgi:hypothetical protein